MQDRALEESPNPKEHSEALHTSAVADATFSADALVRAASCFTTALRPRLVEDVNIEVCHGPAAGMLVHACAHCTHAHAHIEHILFTAQHESLISVLNALPEQVLPGGSGAADERCNLPPSFCIRPIPKGYKIMMTPRVVDCIKVSQQKLMSTSFAESQGLLHAIETSPVLWVKPAMFIMRNSKYHCK